MFCFIHINTIAILLMKKIHILRGKREKTCWEVCTGSLKTTKTFLKAGIES